MRRSMAWLVLVLAGLPLFLGITYLLVSGFDADFDAFIALIIGVIGIVLGLALAGLGYWLLPDRATHRSLALAMLCLSGGSLMIILFLLSLVSAPAPFVAASVSGLVGLVVGGITLGQSGLR